MPSRWCKHLCPAGGASTCAQQVAQAPVPSRWRKHLCPAGGASTCAQQVAQAPVPSRWRKHLCPAGGASTCAQQVAQAPVPSRWRKHLCPAGGASTCAQQVVQAPPQFSGWSCTEKKKKAISEWIRKEQPKVTNFKLRPCPICEWWQQTTWACMCYSGPSGTAITRWVRLSRLQQNLPGEDKVTPPSHRHQPFTESCPVWSPIQLLGWTRAA